MVCAVIKRKQDGSICCPAFWQQEFKGWFDGQDVVKVYPDKEGLDMNVFQNDVHEKTTQMMSKLSY